MSMPQRLALFLLFVAALVIVPAAFASEERLGGTLEGEVDGRAVSLPVLKTDIEADIQGDLATVTVTQTFANPADAPMHAKYLFPLDHGAAVFEMVMEVGGERIRAQIQEVKQAQATFAKAKSEGRAAALLKEHRPNMFTQDIANLMPGLPITTRLRYVQAVPKVDGEYELVIPLVVGPRFQPPHAGRPPAGGEAQPDDLPPAPGVWQLETLPAYPPVHGVNLPPQIEPERVALSARLDGGVPVQAVGSPTHALDVQAPTDRLRAVTLARGRVIDNRDFVLRYRLAGAGTAAGLLGYHDARGGFFSLLIEPPAVPAEADVTPREMVFLLDCSGSMNGLPMDASKAFMRQALVKLRPTDTFRIIRFSDAATEFSEFPLEATPQNVQRGLRYVDALHGEGGTMMSAGIEQALAPPTPPGSVRIVTFLTDGYIGNDHEILALVNRRLNGARLYAFGVGAGVNRFLLDEVGRAGRGFTRYMDPTEDVTEVAAGLAERLQSPVLTDIEIDWGGLAAEETYPAQVPDLFAGQSLRVQGRYARPGTYTVTVKGLVRGRPAQLPVTVTLPGNSGAGEAVALVWARAAIREAMVGLSHPHRGGDALAFETARARVTDLGLKFSLVTKWTAFVAVSEQVYNADAVNTPTRPVPLPMVKGTQPSAYPNQAPLTGVAGPEPATWLGLGLMGLLGFWRLRRPALR
jgi:Ca-activated chloride channel family protein